LWVDQFWHTCGAAVGRRAQRLRHSPADGRAPKTGSN
jgi:hypothetical protein